MEQTKNKIMEQKQFISNIKEAFTEVEFVKYINELHSNLFYFPMDDFINSGSMDELQTLFDVFGTVDTEELQKIIFNN